MDRFTVSVESKSWQRKEHFKHLGVPEPHLRPYSETNSNCPLLSRSSLSFLGNCCAYRCKGGLGQSLGDLGTPACWAASLASACVCPCTVRVVVGSAGQPSAAWHMPGHHPPPAEPHTAQLLAERGPALCLRMCKATSQRSITSDLGFVQVPKEQQNPGLKVQ